MALGRDGLDQLTLQMSLEQKLRFALACVWNRALDLRKTGWLDKARAWLEGGWKKSMDEDWYHAEGILLANTGLRCFSDEFLSGVLEEGLMAKDDLEQYGADVLACAAWACSGQPIDSLYPEGD